MAAWEGAQSSELPEVVPKLKKKTTVCLGSPHLQTDDVVYAHLGRAGGSG